MARAVQARRTPTMTPATPPPPDGDPGVIDDGSGDPQEPGAVDDSGGVDGADGGENTNSVDPGANPPGINDPDPDGSDQESETPHVDVFA